MKRTLLLVIVIVSVLTSCEKLEGDVTFKLNQSISDGELTITFDEYTDSRCPEGANCITAGNVSVELTAQKGAQVAVFQLGDTSPFIQDTSLFDHRIEFVDLKPHPKSGQAVEDKDVRLMLNIKDL